jgi:predicted nucleic acid-binding protein
MRFADTSVLAAALWEDDPRFGRSQACLTGDVAIAAHSLAELYATITAVPKPWRFSAAEADEAVARVAQRFLPVTAGLTDYLLAIRGVSDLGLTSGTVYDALIAQCAIQCEATVIYTWNVKHFRRLGGRAAELAAEPPATE